MWKALFFSLCLAFAAFAAVPDPCAPHPSCQECVSDLPHICGWCSTPVVYRDGGALGNHCVTNDGSHPFACYGVFSTVDCIRGFECDSSRLLCVQSEPGQGIPYDECLRNCTNPHPASPSPSPSAPFAATYDCNTTDWKCYKVPPGHGSSWELCTKGCHQVTPSDVSQSPNPSPAVTYLCDSSNWKCIPTVPGQGTSLEICLQECRSHPSPSPGLKYVCDFTSYQCKASSEPNATSLEQCEQVCVPLYYCDQTSPLNPKCNIAPYPKPGVPLTACMKYCQPHNVTPSDLQGVWRGLQVNRGYQAGEWLINFLPSSVIIQASTNTLKGTVSYVGPSPDIVLTITVVSSTFSDVPVGSVLLMKYYFDGVAPEVRYLMLASGEPNGAAPSDLTSAMASSTGMTWSLAMCQPMTSCKFYAAQQPQRKVNAVAIRKPVPNVDDPCMFLGTCTECLGHTYCGWCSVDVIYHDGTPGKHCAGWNANGSRNPFECHGVFRTDDCNDYTCVLPEGTCVKVPLGGGESIDECLSHCKPSPISPLPSPSSGPAKTYLCNSTDWKCYETDPGHGTSYALCVQGCVKGPSPSPVSPVSPNPSPAHTYLCNATSSKCFLTIPGQGSSLEVCLQACKPRPPIVGSFRGIQVDNAYAPGEWNLELGDAGFVLSYNGSVVSRGSVSQSSKIGHLVLETSSGSRDGYFTEYSGFSLHYTLIVIGKDASDVPSGWDVPWIHGGANGEEFWWISTRNA